MTHLSVWGPTVWNVDPLHSKVQRIEVFGLGIQDSELYCMIQQANITTYKRRISQKKYMYTESPEHQNHPNLKMYEHPTSQHHGQWAEETPTARHHRQRAGKTQQVDITGSGLRQTQQVDITAGTRGMMQFRRSIPPPPYDMMNLNFSSFVRESKSVKVSKTWNILSLIGAWISQTIIAWNSSPMSSDCRVFHWRELAAFVCLLSCVYRSRWATDVQLFVTLRGICGFRSSRRRTVGIGSTWEDS